MRIFVCAGMGLAKNEKINEQARLLGQIIAKNGDTLVQGGSTQGLMGETLKEFLKFSDKAEAFIPEKYFENDHKELCEVFGNKNFSATKTQDEAGRLNAIKMADHVVVMPGGTGTMEECLFVNETARAGEHKTKITLVNIDGFYDNLLSQIERNVQEGLSKKEAIRFEVVKDVKEIEFGVKQFKLRGE